MVLINLFLEFLKIGTFSFGGGMGTLPYIYEMASNTNWILVDNVDKLLTVSQVTPGPLACNIGTIVGFNVSGVLGAFICNIGFVLPAIILMGVIYKFYNKLKNNEKANEVIKIIRAVALAIIITSSFNLFKSIFINNVDIKNISNYFLLINIKSILLCLIIYFFQKYKKINSIFLILISGGLAGLISL